MPLFSYEYSPLLTGGVLVVAFLVMLVSFLKPKRIFLYYLAILLAFTGTLYGADMSGLDSDAVSTIYTRGVGKLGISIMNIYLFALFFLCLLFIKTKPLPRFMVAGGSILKPRPPSLNLARSYGDPVFPYLLFLAICYVVYSLYGLLIDIEPSNVFGSYSLKGTLNLLLMYIITKRCLSEASDIRVFERVFVGFCAAMALYGLIRLPFGGDPANYYSTHEQKGVSITFFDIGQNAVFCITLVSVLLSKPSFFRFGLKGSLISLLCLASVVLSFRRTCWGGLLLVGLWLLFTLDIKRKVVLMVAGCFLLAAITGVYTYRFDAARTGTSLTSDITDSRGELSIKTGRFSELYGAVMATSENPFFGLGTWSFNKEFAPDHGGDVPTSFVHSSLVFVYMKMGLLGLIPFTLMLVGYPVWWIRQRRKPWNNARHLPLADAFFCGFIFWIPDILVGTPLISFRHVNFLALIFAVPVALRALDARSK